MAALDILHFPDSRLRKRAATVEEVDESICRLVDGMLETMYAAPGIGLAATQVNVQKRVIVIDISKERDQPLVLINPEIVSAKGEEQTEEGCLSVPGIYENVSRANSVRLRALDLKGASFEMDAEGLLSVCIQHEIDHLDGRLFIDYLSSLKRARIRKKLEKQKRQGGLGLGKEAPGHAVI